jgi:hypothetical protein
MANPMGGTALPDCSPEVREALAAGRAVVALESTIIAHGMPWPQNLATALQVEAEVRAPWRRAGHDRRAGRAAEGRAVAAELEALARGGPSRGQGSAGATWRCWWRGPTAPPPWRRR